MEIKVTVTDALSASALSSFINTPDRVSYPILLDGSYVVFVHTAVDVPRLNERIRVWSELQGFGVTIEHLDGGVKNLVAEG